jgi:hypothetical protein
MKALTMREGSIRRRSLRKIVTGTFVASALALALAGCGSGSSSGSGGNSGGGGTPTTAPSTGGTSF